MKSAARCCKTGLSKELFQEGPVTTQEAKTAFVGESPFSNLHATKAMANHVQLASTGSNLVRRFGASALICMVLVLFCTCKRLISINLVWTSRTRLSVLRVAATYSMDRAFRRAPLAASCHFIAVGLERRDDTSGDLSRCDMAPPDFVYQNKRVNGVMSFPEPQP